MNTSPYRRPCTPISTKPQNRLFGKRSLTTLAKRQNGRDKFSTRTEELSTTFCVATGAKSCARSPRCPRLPRPRASARLRRPQGADPEGARRRSQNTTLAEDQVFVSGPVAKTPLSITPQRLVEELPYLNQGGQRLLVSALATHGLRCQRLQLPSRPDHRPAAPAQGRSREHGFAGVLRRKPKKI